MNSQALGFVAILVSCILVFGVLSVGQHTQGEDLKNLVNRVAALNQSSCENQNIARVTSNEQIRKPLKRLLTTFANLSREGLANADTPKERARILKFAKQFEADAMAVTILKPTPCNFVPD